LLAAVFLACAVDACVGARAASAEEPTVTPRSPASSAPRTVLPTSFQIEGPNVLSPTLGGNQFWEDEHYFGRWRIQRNVVTNHRRLLDPHDLRHAWGSFDVCLKRLEELKKERSLEPLRGKVVVLVHGLIGNRLMMSPLAWHVERGGEYNAISLTYASTRAPVAEHAQALAALVASLDQAEEINFVGHSLGNLVIRYYMADCEAAGQELDPRIQRVVMIGPPNHGARLAVVLGGNAIFDNTLGLSAQQLGRRWEELAPRLATPSCEFGVIAGGKGNAMGLNPFLEGDDDGTVRVAETRLAGAKDFCIVDMHHALLTASPTVGERTLRFLKEGRFLAEGDRQLVPEGAE